MTAFIHRPFLVVMLCRSRIVQSSKFLPSSLISSCPQCTSYAVAQKMWDKRFRASETYFFLIVSQVLQIDVEQKEVELRSLRCRESCYSWPDGDPDESWFPFDQVIRVLENRNIKARGHYIFKLHLCYIIFSIFAAENRKKSAIKSEWLWQCFLPQSKMERDLRLQA